MHALIPFTLAALSLGAALSNERSQPIERKEGKATAAALGPPAICLPLEVSGRTLSWGDGALTPPKDYPLKKLRPDLLALLESEDTLTRMENLRRAAISLGPLHRAANATEQHRVRIELLSSLRNRALMALLDPKQNAYAAQCAFDLGYLQAALTQVDGHQAASAMNPDFTDGEKELRYAAKHLSKDGAVALGLALAVFDARNGGAGLTEFLHCAKLAGSDALLRKNLKVAAGHFLDQEHYDELVHSMAN